MRIFIALLLLILASCSPPAGEEQKADSAQSDSIGALPEKATVVPEGTDTTDDDHATYFVVIADTGNAYYMLREKMFGLHKTLDLAIDTMGRSFNASKNLIALPENDEDEIYAGDYFPRRFPSANLSLEYLDIYQRNGGEQTIALVAGIYEKQESADSALIALKGLEKKSFTLKSDIYTGCMH